MKDMTKPAIAMSDLTTVEGFDLDDLLKELDETDAILPIVVKSTVPETRLKEVTPEVTDVTIDDLEISDPPTAPVVEPTVKTKRASRAKAPIVTPPAPPPGLDDFMTEVYEPAIGYAKELIDEDMHVKKKVDPFEDLIRDVGDVPEHITVLAYGKNGSGKTTLGASGEGTLVLEVEKDGTFSVRSRGSKAKKVVIKTWADFEKAYWWLQKNPGRFNTVCIDTLTRLLDLCIRDVVLGEKAATQDELMGNDIIKVTLPQRGDIAQKMKYWLNALNNLPMNRIWLCQEAAGSDDADVKDFDVYPDLSRSIRTYVCSDATVIGRMMVKIVEQEVDGKMREVPSFRLIVKPSDKWLTKDRTNCLGAGIVNPKIDEIITKIYAKA